MPLIIPMGTSLDMLMASVNNGLFLQRKILSLVLAMIRDFCQITEAPCSTIVNSRNYSKDTSSMKIDCSLAGIR